MIWVTVFVTICLFLFSGLFFVLAIQEALSCYGYRESNVETTTGYLKQTKYARDTIRNVGGKETRKFKHWTECVFAYTVNGVTYHVKQGLGVPPEQVKQTVRVRYQRNKPQRAYIPKYYRPCRPGMVALYSIPAAAFAAAGIVMLAVGMG